MKRLMLTAVLATIVAIGVTAGADQAPVTVGEGEFGCCCPWAEYAGLCPVDFMTFFSSIDDVCFVLDEAGEVVGYCVDDPDGAYLFRGMTLPELAMFMSDYYGIEPTVGAMVDLFCGIDRFHAPGAD
jgi:hypothetical protein